MIPCPTTGRPLQVSTVDAHGQAICPKCECYGRGGFVSFVGDLRMAYACPGCGELIWLAGVSRTSLRRQSGVTTGGLWLRLSPTRAHS